MLIILQFQRRQRAGNNRALRERQPERQPVCQQPLGFTASQLYWSVLQLNTMSYNCTHCGAFHWVDERTPGTIDIPLIKI